MVRWVLVALAVAAGVHLLAAGTLLALQRGHDGEVLPNVEVAGEPVGGATRSQLEDTVEAGARERLEQPVHLLAGDRDVDTDRRRVGGHIDTDASVEAAWRQGRRGLWRALREQVAARLGRTVEVDLRLELERARLDDAVASVVEQFERDPVPGKLRFVVGEEPDDVEVDVRDPASGIEVHADELAERISERFHETGPIEIDVPAEITAPAFTESDVEAVLPDARRAVDEQVVLTNPAGGDDLVLSPADLAHVLAFAYDEDAREGRRIELVSDGERLREHLGEERMSRIEAQPVEASFDVVDTDEVAILGGTAGFELDAAASAERVVELALEQPPRQGELPGEQASPDFPRADAEALGIEEQVASFTTPLVPGQSRNTNIHLGADYLDGALLWPGERFSLNEEIGPRTRARGFVENGFIDAEGELVEVVGGGSSQLGTTFLNAAWFAGIELIDFQPHSYYFERYPMGREATLSYNTIDVVVRNDSPHGILVVTSYTSSSVTISFYSTTWADVDTWTGEPYDREEGEVRDGFTVDVGRTVHYPDGSSTEESYTHRYQPED